MAPFLKILFCVFSRWLTERTKTLNRIYLISVKRILFDEETQESNESKDTKKKAKRTTSPTQKSGSGAPGKTRKKPKIIHTPPDATGFVRIKKDSGTLIVDTKAVALENKKLKTNEGILQEQIVALRAELDKYKNTGSQPDSSPTNNLPISGGLEGFSKSQYDNMLTFIGEQVKMYQDAQAAAKRLELKKILDPSLDLEAPGHSRAASYQSTLAVNSSLIQPQGHYGLFLFNEGDYY